MLNVVELIQNFILEIQKLDADSVEPGETANYEPPNLDLLRAPDKMGIEDDSKIIILISQQKHML